MTLWLNSNQLIMDSGQVVDCATCPCSTPGCDCPFCTDCGANITATVGNWSGAFACDCSGFSDTYVVPYVGYDATSFAYPRCTWELDDVFVSDGNPGTYTSCNGVYCYIAVILEDIGSTLRWQATVRSRNGSGGTSGNDVAVFNYTESGTPSSVDCTTQRTFSFVSSATSGTYHPCQNPSSATFVLN